MFVYECINSNGRHIGMCVDAFMFGSCCAHNLTAAQVAMLPDSSEPAVLFTRPGGGGVSQRPQRPHGQRPYRPSQAMTMRPTAAADADGAAASSVDKKYHYHPAAAAVTAQPTAPAASLPPPPPPPPPVHRVPSTNFISNSRPNFMSRPAAQPYMTTTTTTTTVATTTADVRQPEDDNENKVDSVWSHRLVVSFSFF